MSAFWDRVNDIKALENSRAQQKQDTAIKKASDFWDRVDAIKAMQNSSEGIFPSAHEMIVNSGYDPSVVAFTQSPFYNNGKGVVIDGYDLTKPSIKSSPKSSPSSDPSFTYYGSGGYSGQSVINGSVTPATLEYLNAELAAYYGMSKETAYQEALANTSYQRAVKDMQDAGLSPAVIFGAGKGSGSDGVYKVTSAVPTGVSSGGSGGSSSRKSGSSNNNGKLFTKGEYYGLSAAAGLLTAVVSKNPGSYWIGQTVAQGFMTAADSLFKRK